MTANKNNILNHMPTKPERNRSKYNFPRRSNERYNVVTVLAYWTVMI